MSATRKTPPKEGTKGFGLEVLPARECLNEAIAMNGQCKPQKCWHYVAINKLMDRLAPGAIHHVRVDAGHVKLNYKGWRYIADQPRQVKLSLMRFDAGLFEQIRARQYTLEFRRTTKILPFTKKRKGQIYAAKERRIAEGRDSYPAPTVTLRKRVEGFSSVV